MLSAPFDYAAPETLEEALDLFGGQPDARLLAGGQSLIPTLKLRLDRPSLLIDLRKLEELRYVRSEDGRTAIGALTTYRDLAGSDALTGGARCLAQAAAAVGDLQVRNLGTIGGSLAHADPSADLPAAALALECTIVARSKGGGERTIEASDFFRGLWTTALEPGEILSEVRFALPSGSGGAYEKLRHSASGFALVGAAAVLEMDRETCRSARVALTGVSGAPLRLSAVEGRLAGGVITEDLVREACAGAGDAIDSPQSDSSASAEYRRAMAGVFARRAILRAAA